MTTDKQIIIDGVDVGWCMNYNSANSKDCETLYVCNKNPNCYYKQLKRKEQECEELKKEKAEILEKTGMIETLQGYTVKDIEYMEQQLDQLKSENKHLNDLLNQALKELEAIQDAYEERE